MKVFLHLLQSPYLRAKLKYTVVTRESKAK